MFVTPVNEFDLVFFFFSFSLFTRLCPNLSLHSHLISYYWLICSILFENLKCYFILSSLVVRWYPDLIARKSTESLSSRKIIDQSMQNDKPEKKKQLTSDDDDKDG